MKKKTLKEFAKSFTEPQGFWQKGLDISSMLTDEKNFQRNEHDLPNVKHANGLVVFGSLLLCVVLKPSVCAGSQQDVKAAQCQQTLGAVTSQILDCGEVGLILESKKMR